MKICSIRIKGYQQFDDLYLDFTNPETGEPVDKVCFIGPNGTGKSTLLDFIRIYFVEGIYTRRGGLFLHAIKLKFNEQEIIWVSAEDKELWGIYDAKIEEIDSWFNDLSNHDKLNPHKKKELLKYNVKKNYYSHFYKKIILLNNHNDLFIYSPPESQQNLGLTINDVPETNVNNALKLFENHPFYHIISNNNVSEFWTQLLFLIKKRQNEREEFENKSENLNKTKKQLIEEFDEKNPKILKKLADLWNKILEKAGLEFDYESASNPIQLNDNLKAYIKLKSTGQTINYNQLSTGIRNFIFRIGHIYSLYFNREIKKGFLLVDEPENSLFPDFLYDLIDIYEEITTDKNGERNTQMFFATHNPIIAAQFEPYERIILEWDETGHVKAFKGKAPVGDDPNDVLRQDFGLNHLMGRKGQEMWEEYLNLKKQLRHMKNGKDKDELISKISKIGKDYNFEQ